MSDCSSKCYVLVSATGDRITVNHCDDRACAPCSGHRTRKVREQFAKVSNGVERVRFMTLTQRTIAGESLAGARKRIRASERKLRQRKSWKAHVDGALRVEETTWSIPKGETEGRWHVHFHYMYEGGFWVQAELTKEWAACGDQLIVDIRASYNVNELLKYSLKTAGVPGDRLVEWAIEMQGVREVEFLGSWRGKHPDVEPQEPATEEQIEAFRYICEEPALERGDHRIVTEARLKYVAWSDPNAPPVASERALQILRNCFKSLLSLRDRVGPRLNKRDSYS